MSPTAGSLQPTTQGQPHAQAQSQSHAHVHARGDAHDAPASDHPIAPRQVNGWGADLDPARRPAVPMERTPPRLDHRPDGPPEPQPQRVKVLKSTERPAMTPVFGTSAPPSGVSGRLREAAFRYAENDLRHWLVLLAADRVNVVEGVVDDLAHGHVPNVWREMGGPAAWKHDRAGTIRKLAVAGAVAGVGWMLLSRRRRSSGRRIGD